MAIGDEVRGMLEELARDLDAAIRDGETLTGICLVVSTDSRVYTQSYYDVPGPIIRALRCAAEMYEDDEECMAGNDLLH